MKHIIKGDEPLEFRNWKAQFNENWQPTFKNSLAGEPKEKLTKSLRKEQGEICCYCESRLLYGQCHIEHFKPQSDPTVDPLDYSNLLCSCQSNLKKGEPRHCGNLKDNWFEADLLISPLDPNCETTFAFEGDGTIKPERENDLAAITTIEKLGLNRPKLIDLRKKAIDPFLDPEVELSNTEFREFVNQYLYPDDQQRYGEFWTTIKYLFGSSIEKE